MKPSIRSERLYAALGALGQIGAYRDERTGLTGVNRLALTRPTAKGAATSSRRCARSGSR